MPSLLSSQEPWTTASGPTPPTSQDGAVERPERAGGLPKAAQPAPVRAARAATAGQRSGPVGTPELPAGPPAGPGRSRWADRRPRAKRAPAPPQIAVTGEPRGPEGGTTPTARSRIGWWGSDSAGGARAAHAPFAGSPRKRTRVCTGPAHRHKSPAHQAGPQRHKPRPPTRQPPARPQTEVPPLTQAPPLRGSEPRGGRQTVAWALRRHLL